MASAMSGAQAPPSSMVSRNGGDVVSVPVWSKVTAGAGQAPEIASIWDRKALRLIL